MPPTFFHVVEVLILAVSCQHRQHLDIHRTSYVLGESGGGTTGNYVKQASEQVKNALLCVVLHSERK